MKRIVKGNHGYINQKKRLQFLYTVFIAAVGIGLYLIGRLSTGTSKNLLTVVAVLAVLPAAKSLVNLILFLPYKSLPEAEYQELMAAAPHDSHCYADLVFTSAEHAMHLDFLCVSGSSCAAYQIKPERDEEIISYLTNAMKNKGISIHVHVFHKKQDILRRMDGMQNQEPIPEELTEFLQTILVA